MLEVRDLSVRFRPRGRGLVHAVSGLNYTVTAGRTVAIIGESGSGKTASSRAIMGLLPRSAQVSGSVRLSGTELTGLSPRALRRHRGKRRGDDLPGPGPVAQPDDAGRPADRRGGAGAREGQPGRGPRARHRAVRAGPAVRAGAAVRRVPAPVLRRHAAAGDDRDGPVLLAAAADRGRGDDRARRDHPGADHAAARRAAGAARHGDLDDQPRPGPGGVLRRRGRRHVRGADGGARGRAASCSATSACRTPARCSAPCPGSTGPRTPRCPWSRAARRTCRRRWPAARSRRAARGRRTSARSSGRRSPSTSPGTGTRAGTRCHGAAAEHGADPEPGAASEPGAARGPR